MLSPRDDPARHFRDAELDVLVAEATAAGRFVMAHAQGADGIKNAVRAGIRSIEHGIYLDDEAIELMLGRGTWLVPTLVAPLGRARGRRRRRHRCRRRWSTRRGCVVEAHRDSFRRAVEAGVKIAMGTDCGDHRRTARTCASSR